MTDPARPGWRRRARIRQKAALAVTVAAVLVASCSGGSHVSQAAFEQRLVQRQKITASQSHCVGQSVFHDYNATAIDKLYRTGLGSLSSTLWSNYIYAMVACTTNATARPGG